MLNKVILQGRCTADPLLKTSPSGKSVTKFTLAVEQDFKNQNGEKGCDFINMVAFNKTAELISEYFTKGRMMVASGKLSVRKYTDNESTTRYTSEVVVNEVYFCGEKQSNSQGQNNGSYGEFTEIENNYDDSDLPF